MSPSSTTSALPTRRALAKGVAWSVPVITVGAAAPAIAASRGCPSSSCFTSSNSYGANLSVTNANWGNGSLTTNFPLGFTTSGACSGTYPSPTVNFTSGTLNFSIPNGASPAKTAESTTFTVSMTATALTSTVASLSMAVSGMTTPSPAISTIPATQLNTAGTDAWFGLESMCLSGTFTFTVGGTQFTKTIQVCQNFCDKGNSTFSKVGTTSYNISYQASYCGTGVTVLCA